MGHDRAAVACALMRTHYDVLGVAPTSTVDEVRRAYRRAAMRWHPDRHAHRTDEATRRFNEIGDAYRVLSDDVRRARYDRTLAESRAPVRSDGIDRSVSHAQDGGGSQRPVLRETLARFVDDALPRVALALRRMPRGRRVARYLRRASPRRRGGIAIGLAIVALLIALPSARPPVPAHREETEPVMKTSESAPRDAEATVIASVFPDYDPVAKTARFVLRDLPRGPVYDGLRPFEGRAMRARLVRRDELNAAYRMYYFEIAPWSPEAEPCDVCSSVYARVMTRKRGDGESVVVPMQLVFATSERTAPR